MLVSISEGDCLEGLLGAILFNAADDMVVDVVVNMGNGTKSILRDDFVVWWPVRVTRDALV
jgi:hypothetical protein